MNNEKLPAQQSATAKRGRPASATLAEAFPDLAAQLVDQSVATTVAKGSSAVLEWQCPIGHRWFAKVYNRTSSCRTGCPVCDGKRVLVGFNDVATTHPDVAQLFKDQSLITRFTAFSGKKQTFRCLTDPTHEWTAPISRITQGSGCPYCSGRRSVVGLNDLGTTHPDLAAQLVDQSLTHSLKAGSNKSVEWRCLIDDRHIWSATVDSRTRVGSGCPYCSHHRVQPGVSDLATTHPDIAASLVDASLASKLSHSSMRIVQWRCLVDDRHRWETSVSNRVHRSGCPVCANKLVQAGVNDLATTHPDVAAQLLDPDQAHSVSFGSSVALVWQCQHDTEHTWLAQVCNRTGSKPTGCPHCRTSQAENDLAGIVRVLVGSNTDVVCGDTSILGGNNQLDVVVPERNIAVEFNGVYWHSEAGKRGHNYHATKTNQARFAGLQLIHVWEDDWWDRKETVIRTLAHKLHAIDRLMLVLPDADPLIAQRVFARQLHVGESAGAEAARFLDNNHIQGAVTATRHFVLRDQNNQIRAQLSLRSPRNNARMKRGRGEWEIQRYATLGVVPGGFSKLLSNAATVLHSESAELTRWVSFAAADVSDGGLYQQAGFTAEAQLRPDYKYVGTQTQWRRAPKETFQRRRFRDDPALIWDESWTERQAAEINKLYRVWDAGKTRWVKDVT